MAVNRWGQLTRSRWLQALITLTIGALILLALLIVVHPEDMARTLRDASPPWVVSALALYLGFLVLRGWRWQIILRASAPATRLGDATAVTAIGWAINSVSPFKLGDLVRAATIAQRARIGIGEAGATVVLERMLDVFALLLLAILAAGASGAQATGISLWQRLAALAGLSLAIAVGGLWLIRDEERSLRWWSRLSRLLPARVHGAMFDLGASALRGFRLLRSPRRLGVSGGLSLAIWVLAVLSLFSFFRSLSSELAPAALMLALTLFIITQAISVTPASVGTYELFFVVTLTAFGASPPALLLAAGLLSHSVGTVFLLVWGGLGALWLRLAPAAPPVGLEHALAGEDSA